MITASSEYIDESSIVLRHRRPLWAGAITNAKKERRETAICLEDGDKRSSFVRHQTTGPWHLVESTWTSSGLSQLYLETPEIEPLMFHMRDFCSIAKLRPFPIGSIIRDQEYFSLV